MSTKMQLTYASSGRLRRYSERSVETFKALLTVHPCSVVLKKSMQIMCELQVPHNWTWRIEDILGRTQETSLLFKVEVLVSHAHWCMCRDTMHALRISRLPYSTGIHTTQYNFIECKRRVRIWKTSLHKLQCKMVQYQTLHRGLHRETHRQHGLFLHFFIPSYFTTSTHIHTLESV